MKLSRNVEALICFSIIISLFNGIQSKCSVREPSGVTSPPQHGDAGFQLSINEEPEFYEERHLYTITLKVSILKIRILPKKPYKFYIANMNHQAKYTVFHLLAILANLLY